MAKQHDPVTRHLLDRGFFSLNAEIFGGLSKSWDFGPYGVEVKKKLKELWWSYFVQYQPHNVGCDTAILTHPQVLTASGHIDNFNDWVVDCGYCQKRLRVDHLLTEEQLTIWRKQPSVLVPFSCCGRSQTTLPYPFHLLLSLSLNKKKTSKETDTPAEEQNQVFLRPETCQGIFVNFLAIQRATRRQLPFGVGQTGKSFRNEVTLNHGIFRTREFEQLELEFFCETSESSFWWDHWTKTAWTFNQKIFGDTTESESTIKQIDLPLSELPHYAKRTRDFFYRYSSFGWGEICSNSDRGNYDLNQHWSLAKIRRSSGAVIPHVIESSWGVDRLVLAILDHAYYQRPESGLIVLQLPPLLTPYFVAVTAVHSRLYPSARVLFLDLLSACFPFGVTYEKNSSVGKSYYYQDTIGTYYCLTVDQETEATKTVTLRHRDSREQTRMALSDLKEFLLNDYQKHWRNFFENPTK